MQPNGKHQGAPALDAAAAVQEAPQSEGLRYHVAEAIKRRGMTQDQAAKEAGLSATALSQWLQDKYQGSNANVESKLAKWLETQDERLSLQATVPEVPSFFESQTAREIMDAFRYAQSLEDIVAVVGAPGIGKSTTCQEYRQRASNVWVATVASHTTGVVPVLKEICEAVGGGYASGASAIAREITRRIRGTHGLIIIDEAHHLSLSALDAIRALHDSTGIGVALVGSIELSAKLSRMPQLHSRIGLQIIRSRALVADVAALLDAWGIAGKSERNYLARIARDDGALRSVTKVLRLASATARGAGESLRMQHIEDAALMLSARATEVGDHV